MQTPLSEEEKTILLRLAREALEATARQQVLPPLDLKSLPPRLRDPGASFVTLKCGEQLRGCIGTLKLENPLAEDVRQHTRAAASKDYRFAPVAGDETALIDIEVSVLTPPQPLEYHNGDDLIARLQPGVDGVILIQGTHRATFLPQVWEKIPNPQQFLELLCEKAYLPKDAWRTQRPEILTYKVDSFHQPAPKQKPQGS